VREWTGAMSRHLIDQWLYLLFHRREKVAQQFPFLIRVHSVRQESLSELVN
jgi:hypothetical protein